MNKKRRGRPRGKSDDSERKSDRFEREDRVDRECNFYKSKPNDWRWYAQNEQMLKDTASFPYTWPLGHQLNLGPNAPAVNAGSIPGIMTIDISPSFGWADNENAPINIAARNIYSYVRHANSGHTNYDSPDLMLYLMAMDSAYSFLAWMKRVYGVAMTYSYTNRYYARAMIKAMGVDYEDLVANLADFRAYINTYAVKIGSLVVPASMSYTAKHVWMYSGYYLDSNQDKAQTYMFNPRGFFVFSLDSDGAGQLSYSQFTLFNPSATSEIVKDSEQLKISAIMTYGSSIIDPILAEEDFAIMGGDILKAFGPSNVYMVEQITESYVVYPSYDEEVLDQIQNATLMGYYVASGQFGFETNPPVLKQSTGKNYLQFMPAFRYPWAVTSYSPEGTLPPGINLMLSDRLVTFNHGDITPANTMEASRLTNIYTSYTVSTGSQIFAAGLSTTIGSEVAHGAHMFYFAEQSASNKTWWLWKSRTLYLANALTMAVSSTQSAATVVNSLNDTVNRATLVTMQLSQFDWHPPVSMVICTQAMMNGTNLAGYVPFAGWYLDVNYYTIVTSSNLQQMTQTALLSMFNVRQYGRAAQ